MQPLTVAKESRIVQPSEIFRLAATMYANTTDVFSSAESQLQLIICLFVSNENIPKSYIEIIDGVLSTFKYHISEDEVISIIKRHRSIFSSTFQNSQEKVCLSKSAYEQSAENQKRNIDYYIDLYTEFQGIENTELCRKAIYRYLYELTTTNINSYRVLLSGKGEKAFSDNELSVSLAALSEEEKKAVHDFLSWNNPEKNVALGNIVLCCLEYCLLVNGDSPNQLLRNSIRKRTIFLDTNIIFRALGINGTSRKNVVIAFLNKCKQANLSLAISSQTMQEFFQTVDQYIKEISYYPRGKIYLGAYESLSDYTMFSFYDDWIRDHPQLSLTYFKAHIDSAYKKLVSTYKISNNVKIPSDIFDSDSFKEIRNAYSSEIHLKKKEVGRLFYDYDFDGYNKSSSHDATVVHFVEVLREKHPDEEIFFVSSDKALRFWDMSRMESKYPVVIYPSQLFLILVKLYGRSANDFDSFVSFINIRTNPKQLSPEKANIVLSGISSITEDIRSQEILVSSIFNDDFQEIILHSNTDADLYVRVQQYSQNYLEDELRERDSALLVASKSLSAKDEEIAMLTETVEKKTHAVALQEKTINNQNEFLMQHENTIEQHRKKVCKFAERKTRFAFLLKWYIFPVIVAMLIVSFCLFILLQFTFCDKPWNVANIVIAYVANTTFGKNVDNYIAVIDGAAFTLLVVVIIPQLWVKPWDKEKKEADRQKRIEKYIKRNNL